MSYVIHVWETPLPSTFDEAVTIALERGDEVLGQNPGFLILAGRLKSRFPCICDAPDGVWSDGPLDGRTEERVYVLGISRQHEDVIAHVLRCAGSLGLTVFDMQAAQAYLPSGQVLSPAATARMAEPCEGLGQDEVRAAIYDGMLQALGEFGFVHEQGGEQALTLQFAGGYHQIRVAIGNNWPRDFTFSLHISTGLDAVSRIVAPLQPGAPEAPARYAVAVIAHQYLHGEADKTYAIDSRAALALAVTDINTVLFNTLLPLLDQISDIAGMEAMFNRPPGVPPFQPQAADGYHALTLARLAGHPGYPALCQRIREGVPADGGHLQQGLTRLIACLDAYDAAAPAPLAASAGAATGQQVAQFIADYDGSQLAAIDLLAADAATPSRDPHAHFRSALMQGADAQLSDFSLRLLRDMFSVEARAGSASAFRWPVLQALAQALLSRGGVGELALFAQLIPLSALAHKALRSLPLDAGMAESLRYACEERSSNPLFAAQAAHYVSLERYFAALAARGGD
jgi:hypothetical protein